MGEALRNELPKEEQELRRETHTVLGDAYVYRGLKLVDAVISLNNHILTTVFNIRIASRMDSFHLLAAQMQKKNKEIENLQQAAHLAQFPNILHSDYSYGPGWSVSEALRMMPTVFEGYINSISAYFDSNPVTSAKKKKTFLLRSILKRTKT